MSSAWVPEITIGEIVVGIVGALVIVDRDEPVHEGARGDQRDVAERAGAAFLLGRQPAAAKPLRIADHGVELGVLDRFEHLFGFDEIGRQRLLDQHRQPALDRHHDRIDVQMLVGGDNGAGHFRPLEQFDMALRHEVGADFLPDFAGAIRVLFGEADPFDRRMARRHLAAEQPDASAADDGEADPFCITTAHRPPPTLLCILSVSFVVENTC